VPVPLPQDELQEVVESVQESRRLPPARFSTLMATPALRRALALGCGLMLLQQLAGINTVMYYSASIYAMAGFKTTLAIWLAGFTALAQFVGMVINVFLVERLGRRTLILSSLLLVTASLVLIGEAAAHVSTRLAPDAGMTAMVLRGWHLVLAGMSFWLSMFYSDAVLTSAPQCSGLNNVLVGRETVRSCYTCVEVEGCGFCGSLGSCLVGNATTDEDGVCARDSWQFGACKNGYGYMSVATMVFYLLAFGVGMGPTPWTVNAEIYPLHVRWGARWGRRGRGEGRVVISCLPVAGLWPTAWLPASTGWGMSPSRQASSPLRHRTS
jgi:MFS transporter, SP family, solute carrier family 2 (myo-inositol transporter), member 13